MRVDVHTHYLPAPYRDRLREWGGPVRVEDGVEGPVVVHAHGSFPLVPGFREPAARLEWMDAHGIDCTLASVSTPNPNEGPFTARESTELVRAINDGYAALQADHPGRFAGLGSLPLRDPETAAAEVDRIVDLGLAGVAIPTSVRGEKLSQPDLRPVFDRLDELDLTAFVHPTRNAQSGSLHPEEWLFNPMAVFPAETTLQIGRLIFDGFFDRHDFDVVLSHMGGALTHLVGRFERGREQFRSADGDHPERPTVEYLESFYYDPISFHAPAMEAAIETVGADRLVFGSDYPFGMEKVEDTLADVDGLDLDGMDRRAIMGGTAADLFDL